MVADRLAVEMPICREVSEILYAQKPVREAVQELMGREMRFESE
jgi:glycerol-3-phosphate dehydrogenase